MAANSASAPTSSRRQTHPVSASPTGTKTSSQTGPLAKAVSPELTATEPDIPWNDIAGMRDFLAHHYFATNPEIIQLTIDKRLAPLAEAVESMQARLPHHEADA